MSNPSSSPGSRPLEQLKVAELRDELRKRGLSLKGVKKELFERLEEVVRKEQLGASLGGSEIQDDVHEGQYGNIDPEGVAKNRSNYQDHAEQSDESMLYFRESEKSVQDSALIVKNASRYVEASDDAAPLLMEPYKAKETLGPVLEDSKDSGDHNVDHLVPESGNVALWGDDGQNNDVLAVDITELVLDNQANGKDSSLKLSAGDNAGFPETGNQGGKGNADIQADITGVAPTDSSWDKDFLDSENFVLAQESGPSVSVISGPDASIPAIDNALIANDYPVEDVKFFAKTNLTSISVAPFVQEQAEDQVGVICKEERSNFDPEGMKQGEPCATSGDKAVMETLDRSHVVEDSKESSLTELVEDISVSKVSITDTVIQEVAEPLVKQEENQDVSMSEPVEGVNVDIKPPVGSMEALVVVMDNVKSEDAKPDSERVLEKVPTANQEPVESESQRERGSMPGKRGGDDSKELSRSWRVFDRSQPRDAEYEMRRAEHACGIKDGEERNKAEGRAVRVFREERRMDTKETDLKPEKVVDSFVRSGQKRKEEEDSKQQVPTKRMRRWNSGNQLVGGSAKPLTMGTLEEITSLEFKKEGPDAMALKFPPKTGGLSRSLPTAAKADSDSNGDKRAVPPLTHSSSASLKIERFVRPFTLKAVKDMLAEFGHCVDFWMDQIKTHCYITFSKMDEAVAARNALYGKQWPPSFGNYLVADFVDASEVKIRCDGSFEKANTTPAPIPRGLLNASPAPLVHPSASLYHSDSNTPALAPHLREQQPMQPPRSDPPVPTLEDLFRKTKTRPPIYYLPLTEEQIGVKLAATKNRELQVTIRPISRV